MEHPEFAVLYPLPRALYAEQSEPQILLVLPSEASAMTSTTLALSDGTESECTGTETDAPPAPRIQQVADLLAEARARRIRSDSAAQAESA